MVRPDRPGADLGGLRLLGLSVVGVIGILGSDNSLPFFEHLQRESRGLLALGALGGGMTAAGLRAGLGSIVRMMAAARIPDAPEPLGPDEEEEAESAREIEPEGFTDEELGRAPERPDGDDEEK